MTMKRPWIDDIGRIDEDPSGHGHQTEERVNKGAKRLDGDEIIGGLQAPGQGVWDL